MMLWFAFIVQLSNSQIVQLHHSLGQYRCTILLGPKTSGISTCYRTLSATYKRMGKPSANIIVINPAAYSWEQVYRIHVYTLYSLHKSTS